MLCFFFRLPELGELSFQHLFRALRRHILRSIRRQLNFGSQPPRDAPLYHAFCVAAMLMVIRF